MISSDNSDMQIQELMPKEAKFDIGQLITHKLFDYRGVIVDIDPIYLGSEEWYQKMAKSKPPKNAPWYKVLVNDSLYETYVAERNLRADTSIDSIDHPMILTYFDDFQGGKYINHSWQKN